MMSTGASSIAGLAVASSAGAPGWNARSEVAQRRQPGIAGRELRRAARPGETELGIAPVTAELIGHVVVLAGSEDEDRCLEEEKAVCDAVRDHQRGRVVAA